MRTREDADTGQKNRSAIQHLCLRPQAEPAPDADPCRRRTSDPAQDIDPGCLLSDALPPRTLADKPFGRPTWRHPRRPLHCVFAWPPLSKRWPTPRATSILSSPFAMRRGGALVGAKLAYETWGTLNRGARQRDFHSHRPVAERARGVECGRSLARLVGRDDRPRQVHRHEPLVRHLREHARQSCKGSTGPASINPETGELYRLEFPEPDARRRRQRELRRWCVGLGIDKLACLIGNSMGGMSALAYLAQHPGTRARTSAFRPRRRRSRSRLRSARCSARRSGSIRTGSKATTTTSTIPKPACRSRANSASSPIGRRWNGSDASRAFAWIPTSARKNRSPSNSRSNPISPVTRAVRAQFRSEQLPLSVARERLVRHRRIRAVKPRRRRSRPHSAPSTSNARWSSASAPTSCSR